ncbi:MAG: hypothetical protein ABSF69_20350, partial [Polyangiaceae bacterium]
MSPGWRSRLPAAGLALATGILGPGRADAEIPLGQAAGWHLSTDGRVNAFLSVAAGTGLPAQEQAVLGAGTADTPTSTNGLTATRIRNGLLT